MLYTAPKIFFPFLIIILISSCISVQPETEVVESDQEIETTAEIEDPYAGLSQEELDTGLLNSIRDIEKSQLLLQAGADINTRYSGGDSLLISIIGEYYMYKEDEAMQVAYARFLLENGADVNMAGNYGWPPLYCASLWGDPEMVKLLIESGAELNSQIPDDQIAGTALMRAAIEGYSEIVQIFIDAGADKDIIDSFGYSALAYADMYGQQDIVDLLLEGGADPAGLDYEPPEK